MRHFDLSPLYRSTVGFDRMLSLLDQVAGASADGAVAYPPYNIERTGENAYRITVAVADGLQQSLPVADRLPAAISRRQSQPSVAHGLHGQ